MADLDYKKENMKELHAPDKKVKAGVYVIAALLVLVYLLPIYVMLNQSFRFMTDLSPRLYLPEKWTLDNYIQAFQNADLWKGMKNSFVYVVEVCILKCLDIIIQCPFFRQIQSRRQICHKAEGLV